MQQKQKLLGTLLDARWVTHRPKAWTLRQRNRLKRLIDFARANSPYYRDAYRSIANDDEELRHYPPVKKAELMAKFDDWVTDRAITKPGIDAFVSDYERVGQSYLDRYAVWTSSGSTGTPGIYVHDNHALAVYSALEISRAMFDWVSMAKASSFLINHPRMAVLVATGAHYAGAAWASRNLRRHPLLANHVRLLSVMAPTESLIKELNEFQPFGIISYPTAIDLLAHEQKNGKLSIAPHIVVTGGECLSLSARANIGSAFGCKVRDTYGSSEFISIAYDCGHGWLHVNSDWLVFEPVDKNYEPVKPGEQSHSVLLTNLANYVQPFIRYELGDSIVVNPDPCACGRSLPAIRVEGRKDDLLLFDNDGISKAILPLAIGSIVEETQGVHNFQLIQRGPASLAMRLEMTTGVDQARVWQDVETNLRQYLREQGLSDRIVLQRENELPMRNARTGKFRQVMREMDA